MDVIKVFTKTISTYNFIVQYFSYETRKCNGTAIAFATYSEALEIANARNTDRQNEIESGVWVVIPMLASYAKTPAKVVIEMTLEELEQLTVNVDVHSEVAEEINKIYNNIT